MRLSRQLQLIGALGLIGGLGVVVVFGYYAVSHSQYSREVYHREKLVSASENTSKDILLKNTTTSVKLLFVGDMMFDRQIRIMANKHGSAHLFSCIDPLLARHDIVLGNLEGPITAKPSTSMGTKVGSPENYYFTFPTSTASLLFAHNIKLVSIGNNHINNQGRDGIHQTKKFLEREHVEYFGGLVGDSSIYQTIEKGVPISFINYNQFGGEVEETIVQQIKAEKASGRVVIVFAHWGEEYQDVVAPVRKTAKHFVESGADLIVGAHPHIVQSHEMIGQTPVYYSLGNFMFDQYFQKEVMEGLALSVDLSSDHSIRVEEIPVVLNKDGRTCPKEK